ncbi:hypothetical protein GCM10027072_41180 [Streptomyces bullii]
MGAPPRTPGGGTTRPTPDGSGRPPGSRDTSSRTRPTDNRPPTASGRGTQAGTRAAEVADSRRSAVPARPASTAPTPADTAQHTTAAVLFADRLVLVLSGQRPVHWMLRHTRGRAYDELAWLAERGPLRTRGARPVVRDIGYFEPRPGAIEAFARIGAGDQLRAMAFRLERGGDLRWRCTAVELGGPGMRRAADD